jgi:hypothetical protein
MLVASSLRDSVAMPLLGTAFLSSSESRERSDSVWSEQIRHAQYLYNTSTYSNISISVIQLVYRKAYSSRSSRHIRISLTLDLIF